MKKGRYISHSFIRFRQWSRKSYAIFASLGLCVTIGQLRKNITECALCKQKALHTKETDLQHESNTSFQEENRESILLSPEPILFLFTQLNSLKYSYTEVAQQAVVASVLYHIYIKKRLLPIQMGGNLFFNFPSYDH